MKRLTAFAILMGMAAATAHAATAFDALRVAQAEMSGASLVEISGTRGAPEPSEWTFAFADQTARGGVTELTVRRGAVASRRTPLQDAAGITSRPALFVPTVRVDSEKAFDIANRTAASRRIAFHSVDYVLSSNGTMPIWALTLRSSAAAQDSSSFHRAGSMRRRKDLRSGMDGTTNHVRAACKHAG